MVPVAELAHPVNRPGMTVAWSADQAQQPLKWMHAGTDLPRIPGQVVGDRRVGKEAVGYPVGGSSGRRPLLSSWYRPAGGG